MGFPHSQSYVLVAADANVRKGSDLIRITLRPSVNTLFAAAAFGTETTKLAQLARAIGSELISCGYGEEFSVNCLAASFLAKMHTAVTHGPSSVAHLVSVGHALVNAPLSLGDRHIALVSVHVLSIVSAVVHGEVGVGFEVSLHANRAVSLAHGE